MTEPESSESTLQVIEQKLAGFVTSTHLGSALEAIEKKLLELFIPKSTWDAFRAELDSSLSKWCEQAFASLEERAAGVVRNELERLKVELLAKVELPPASSVEPQSDAPVPTTSERPAEQIDPLSLARDAFPTLQEFTQIGYYADTYEHRKAEWEARKAAVNTQEIGAANVATGV